MSLHYSDLFSSSPITVKVNPVHICGSQGSCESPLQPYQEPFTQHSRLPNTVLCFQIERLNTWVTGQTVKNRNLAYQSLQQPAEEINLYL